MDIRKSADKEMRCGTACVIEYQLERSNLQRPIIMSANDGSSLLENRAALDLVIKRTHDEWASHLIWFCH